MLTLCRLAAPVSIRPPQSPDLKPFHFFMSRALEPDGSERLLLHMGYFATLTEAERCARLVRGRFPEAFATPAPEASLTDTQVLKLLETRGVASAPERAVDRRAEEIALLRPEDTTTRRALKEAVARGAPVLFAVQLHWSEQPLDVSRMPSLEAFEGYTLYATETRRAGHCRHFLRLGFFTDAMAAKDAAAEMLSKFPSAAVVPVASDEVTRVREAGVTAAIPYLVQPPLERAPDSTPAQPSAPEPKPAPSRARPQPEEAETLAQLAEREIWSDADSVSESGVRHLRIEVDRSSKPARQGQHRLDDFTARMRRLWLSRH